MHEMDDLMGLFQCNPCSPDSNLKEAPLSTVLVYHMSMNQPSDQFYTGTYPWDDEISNEGDDHPMEQDAKEDGGQSSGEGLHLLDYSGCFLSNDVSIHPETQKSTDNLPQTCEGKLREARPSFGHWQL
jgi:hypothetical protein